MTYEETKKLLEEMRYAKRRVNIQQRRLLEIRNNYDAIATPNNHCVISNGSEDSTVEKVILRLERTREEIARDLEEFFKLEDSFTDAVNSLSPIERDIILDFYFSDMRIWEIGNELGYSKRSILYIKNQAIEKIRRSM